VSRHAAATACCLAAAACCHLAHSCRALFLTCWRPPPGPRPGCGSLQRAERWLRRRFSPLVSLAAAALASAAFALLSAACLGCAVDPLRCLWRRVRLLQGGPVWAV
jgi:hypothetical protein